MFMTPVPTPMTKGAPGLPSWWTTRPASTSALATATQAVSDAGPCAPAETDGASTSGTSSSAQASALVQQTSSSMSGGEVMARQAKLSAAPAAAAISCMVYRVSPPKGLETTIGLRVPRSMAANCTTSTTSLATSSGRAMLMAKSMLGSASTTRAAASTSASVERRRSPLSGSLT